jgi:hypothetical protein
VSFSHTNLPKKHPPKASVWRGGKRREAGEERGRKRKVKAKQKEMHGVGEKTNLYVPP